MTQYRTAVLPYAEVVLTHPLTGKALLAARLLDDSTILRLEEVLPAHVQSVREITNIHQALLFELLADRRIELLVHLAAVHDGRATAFLGRDHAEETDACGPAVHVRTLVVIQNALVFRVGSGSMNATADALAGQIAVLRIDFRVHARRHPLEVLRGLQTESAKQDAPMGVQLLCDVLPIVARPIRQVHLIGSGLHHQRKGLVRGYLAFTNGIEMSQVYRFAANCSETLGRRSRSTFHIVHLKSHSATHAGAKLHVSR